MNHALTPRLAAVCAVLMLAAALPARAELTDTVRKEILILEQSRSLQDGRLVELAGDGDTAIRIRAIRALGRIQDADALEAMAKGLRDGDPAVRAEAAFAVGQIFDPVAEPVVMTALDREKDATVRGQLVEALGKCGSEAAIEPLAAMLRAGDDHAAEAAQALGILARRGYSIEAAGQALIQGLRSADPEVTWRAAFAVQRGNCKSAFTGLHRALLSPDVRTRIFACRAVAASRQVRLGERVVPLLKDEDWRVRVEALKAIGATKNDFYTSRASLLLEDPNEHVLLTAIDTMGRLGGVGLARLREFEQSSDWRIRSAYLTAHTRSAGEGALIGLRDAAKNPDWRIRRAAADAFALLETEQALILLEPMLNDEMPQVQAAALNALTAYPQLEAVEHCRKMLDSSDLAVLTLAANAAGQRLDRSALPKLLDAYDQLMSPVDTEAMVALLEAIGQVIPARDEDGAVGSYRDADRARAVQILEAASSDTDITVARRAAQSLALILGQDAPALAAPVFLPPTFDADLALAMETLAEPPVARITTNRGDVVLRLLPGTAPATVANFVTLARDGFYNGLMFHRVVSDFVIQTGDPRGDGWGGPGYSIRCEYSDHPYTAGTVGMATAGKDTGGSQWFITHSPQPHLEGGYTVFGEVIEGQDIVDRIQVGDTIREVQLEGL